MKKLILILALTLFPLQAVAGNNITSSRDVYLRGEVNEDMADLVADKISQLNKENTSAVIKLHISSPGGYVYSGLRIIDAMKSSKAPVETICSGYCMSMAATILASGDIRVSEENATILTHMVGSQCSGKIPEMINCVNESIRLQNVINGILMKATHKKLEVVMEMQSYDHFMSPEEAQSLGLIDFILQ